MADPYKQAITQQYRYSFKIQLCHQIQTKI